MPFVSTTSLGYLGKHLAAAPTPLREQRDDVPPDLAEAVMRSLEKQPDDRFQDVSAFLEVVQRFA